MTEAITHIVLFKYKPSITWRDSRSIPMSSPRYSTDGVKPGTNRLYMKRMKAGTCELAYPEDVNRVANTFWPDAVMTRL